MQQAVYTPPPVSELHFYSCVEDYIDEEELLQKLLYTLTESFCREIREVMHNFWSLNTDVFFEVLSRLPTKCLLGLKCVCKGWHRLLSDRLFIKSQSQQREPIFGFFFQHRFHWCLDDIKTINHIPVESEGLQQRVFRFLPEDVVVMASCNGLVCLRSCYPFKDPSIYVCNPLNREWIRLDWTKADKETSIALVFDPCREPIGHSTNFKLVQVQQCEAGAEDFYFSFDIYSSDTGDWRTSKEICLCNDRLYKNKGTLIGGILHWLTNGDEILTFNIENELSWLISVPISAATLDSVPEACIGESDGKLHYVMVSENGFHVWCLEDYFEFHWTLKHSKSLDAMEEEHPEFLCNLQVRVTQRLADSTPWMDPLAFKDGYVLMRVCTNIYLYHVNTNKMKKVCGQNEMGTCSTFNPIVLPYSLSLVPLSWA
ncbi:F-box protein At5g49610-like [Pistacia vera]|uniref:F-box protein At5g49610-like n=1 Tax=Pistacia vera TaxID=55513 RepID=UPI0012634000|nr:F-box protein At5g49610-like [Pistacia vera]